MKILCLLRLHDWRRWRYVYDLRHDSRAWMRYCSRCGDTQVTYLIPSL